MQTEKDKIRRKQETDRLIEERIDAISKWLDEYPDISQVIEGKVRLKTYIKTKNITDDKFEEIHEKLMDYRLYILRKLKQGKLSKEQEEKFRKIEKLINPRAFMDNNKRIETIKNWLDKQTGIEIIEAYAIAKKTIKKLKQYAMDNNIDYEELIRDYKEAMVAYRVIYRKAKDKKLSQDEIKQLEEIGISIEKRKVDVDERIDKFSAWLKKYPNVKMTENPNMSPKNKKILESYVKYSGNSYDELLIEYKQMQRYCQYFRTNYEELTDEQKNKLKNLNLGNKFGYSDEVEKSIEEHSLNHNKIKYIIDYYTSMDEFIQNYFQGNLEEEDCEILQENLIKRINIEKHPSTYIENVMDRVLDTIQENNTEIIIYDGARLSQFIESLEQEQKEVLKDLCGFEDGKVKLLKEIGKKMGISGATVSRIKNSAVNKIVDNIEQYAIKIREEDIGKFFEEFVEGKTIFISDKGYPKKEPQIKIEELSAFCEEIWNSEKNVTKRRNETQLQELASKYYQISDEEAALKATIEKARQLLGIYNKNYARGDE